MITLAELKIYLKIDSWDTSKDDQLNLAISNAKGFLEDYLWYSLELDEEKKGLFYGYDNQFEVKHVDINSVSQIRYTDDEFDPTWTNYNDSTNYKVFLDRWLIKTRDKIWRIIIYACDDFKYFYHFRVVSI